MKISAKTKVCTIIGDPVEHSLSPAMHNAAYEALGIDSEFVFTASHVTPEQLPAAIAGARALGIRGITCTIPHKVAVMELLDHVDAIARKIGAVNTVVNDNGSLSGYNTDYLGCIVPLEQRTILSGKKVALLGAGGAARAMAYGVLKQGAHLTIYNRTLETATALARDLEDDTNPIAVKLLTDIASITEADIIINSTSIGMGDSEGQTLVPAELLNKKQIVFDAIYKPHETQLLKDAKAAGAQIVYGYEMLLHQGVAQFELYTGTKAPLEVMKDVIIPKNL